MVLAIAVDRLAVLQDGLFGFDVVWQVRMIVTGLGIVGAVTISCFGMGHYSKSCRH
jgi:hypothetical protein